MSVQKDNFRIVLISTYELGRQPFGLASPAAWLHHEGYSVTTADVAIEPFPTQAVNQADLVAFYIPMHTATRLATEMVKRVREINPNVHLCCYGLYAPVNENYLRLLGVSTILGGEFEEELVNLSQRLSANGKPSFNDNQNELRISLSRLQFRKPDRNDLPDLSNYAKLCDDGSTPKITGYVEASRGCKHHCRHCPIVPVYEGKFRIVQKEVVMEDIRQQVEAGAQHVTFGDPDFLNGPAHAIPIVRSLHEEFPNVSYDVTIKIEHLLKHQNLLPILKETGCAIVTSAVESIDDHILEIFDKRHSREDFVKVVQIFDEIDLNLNPTFVTFTPWTTLRGYKELLSVLNDLDLIQNISPVQFAIRLLIPHGSKLLEHPETKNVLGKFDRENLSYEWRNPDQRVENLFRDVRGIVHSGQKEGKSRYEVLKQIWNCTNGYLDDDEPLPKPQNDIRRSTIPYLNEPWYC